MRHTWWSKQITLRDWLKYYNQCLDLSLLGFKKYNQPSEPPPALELASDDDPMDPDPPNAGIATRVGVQAASRRTASVWAIHAEGSIGRMGSDRQSGVGKT